MITVRIKGGMGNQMFQYAFGKRMAEQLNTTMQLDLSLLLDRSRNEIVHRNYDLSIFNVDPKFVIAPKMLSRIYKIKFAKLSKGIKKWSVGKKNIIKEPHFHLSQDLLDNPVDNAVYDGWWQSGKYFSDIADTIKKEFSFKNDLLPISKDLMNEITNTNSICLNVRRTDFLKVDNLNTTNKDYFLKAAEVLAKKVEKPYFFIFSDDVQWCEENLQLNYPTQVVNHDHKGVKFGNYLRLMIACDHYIIPNSSFAWWAIWLNENPNKIVVAPKNWFNDTQFDTSDLVPADWLRM